MLADVSDVKLRSVGYDEPAVRELVSEALADLGRRYGGSGDDTPVDAADFTPPHGDFLVAELNGRLVGCGGWRAHGADAELKRMYTDPAVRGRGIARMVLRAVEDSARAAGHRRVILECGDRQPEAIALYEACGYTRIPDFGYYAGHSGVRSFAHPL